MNILVVAKNSSRYREVSRRSQLLQHDFTFASSPKKIAELSAAYFDVVLDHKDAYDNRRYSEIKSAIHVLFEKAEAPLVWVYDANALPKEMGRL